MPTHEPNWVETKRDSTTVYFRCTVCGARISGNVKAYDDGRWFPSIGNH